MNFFSQVGFLEKLLFTKHLTIMVQSGITSAEAIRSLAEQLSSGAWKNILDGILKDIENGETLSSALKKYPRVFDSVYVNLIGIGEASGTLQESLGFLVQQLTKEYLLRKKVKGILLYPTIVLTIAFVMSGLISFFILPKLAELFRSFDVVLPWTTRMLLALASLMQFYGVVIFSGIIMALIGFRLLVTLPLIRPFWHHILLHLPLVGSFLKHTALASMFRNLGIMMKSGLPITTALQVEYATMDNFVFKQYIARLQSAVSRGETLSDELSLGDFKHIPPLVEKMLSVGEKTGKLEESFLYLGDFFEEEVDSIAKNFATILEPVLLVIIGLVVAFLALAIISPIYSLTGSVRR